jgi:hypothetical protein
MLAGEIASLGQDCISATFMYARVMVLSSALPSFIVETKCLLCANVLHAPTKLGSSDSVSLVLIKTYERFVLWKTACWIILRNRVKLGQRILGNLSPFLALLVVLKAGLLWFSSEGILSG